MHPKGQNEPIFVVGRRYSNRLGEYEVLEIQVDKMRIRYDNGAEQQVSVQIQARIATNMARQASALSPYSATFQHRNDVFFFTLGFLTSRVTILEAFVPPQSVHGFSADYHNIKGSNPSQGQKGLVLHPQGSNKWGSELRTTFRATFDELTHLDFGPDINVLDDPLNPGINVRINNNSFWWKLLGFGFEMGAAQDLDNIRSHIPIKYRNQFDNGLKAGS
ncbi:MAG: hypothetical protein E3J60_04185 [Dehalococcoidia bacterium]|nr:MAG: hypothetical protein E3J60_04185 [Dehalococcoidia bacterium]